VFKKSPCGGGGGGSVLVRERAGFRRRKARVQIAVATLSGNSLRQTVHTHQLVADLLRVAEVTAGLAGCNGSLPPGLWRHLQAD